MYTEKELADRQHTSLLNLIARLPPKEHLKFWEHLDTITETLAAAGRQRPLILAYLNSFALHSEHARVANLEHDREMLQEALAALESKKKPGKRK